MSEATPTTPSRLRAWMAVPLALSALALGGALWAVLKLDQGRPATGERVTLTLATECAPAAKRVLERRVSAIGLGDPVLAEAPGGLRLTATLPGLPDDRSAIPALLTRPGRLGVSAAGRPVADQDDVVATALNLDMKGSPYAEVQLNGLAVADLREATKEGGRIEVTLDGAVLLSEDVGALRDDRLRLVPAEGGPGEKMRAVADWSILLGSGALPCAVTLSSLAAAGTGG